MINERRPIMRSRPTVLILVVDDQKAVSETIAIALRSCGYQMCTASSSHEAQRYVFATHLYRSHSAKNGGIRTNICRSVAPPKYPMIAMSETCTADEVSRTLDRFYAKGKYSPDKLVFMVDGLPSAHRRHAQQGTGRRVHLRTPRRGEQA